MNSLDRHLINSYWHLICHKSELPNSKDFIRFNWYREELVLFRDGENIVSFDNKCPHRGARIYLGDTGSQPAACPYHGWRYSSSKVIVSDSSSFSQCSIKDIKLNEYKIAQCGDFIFVSIEPLCSLEEQLDGLWAQVESISKSISNRVDFNNYIYESNWKIALENALEPYHVPMIHPTSLGMLKLNAGANEFYGKNSVWYSEVCNERINKQLAGLSRFFSLEYKYAGYMSIYIFPFTMISSTYGYSYSLQNFFPSTSSEQANFYSRLLSSKLSAKTEHRVMDSFFESTAKVNRQVFDEDHKICKRVHSATWSPYPPRYYSDKEEKLLHFRKSCLDVMRSKNILPNA